MKKLILALIAACALVGCVREPSTPKIAPQVAPVASKAVEQPTCYIDFATDVIVLPEGTPICRSIPLANTQDDIFHYNPTHGYIEGCVPTRSGIAVKFVVAPVKDESAFIGKIAATDGTDNLVAIGSRTSSRLFKQCATINEPAS